MAEEDNGAGVTVPSKSQDVQGSFDVSELVAEYMKRKITDRSNCETDTGNEGSHAKKSKKSKKQKKKSKKHKKHKHQRGESREWDEDSSEKKTDPVEKAERVEEALPDITVSKTNKIRVSQPLSDDEDFTQRLKKSTEERTSAEKRRSPTRGKRPIRRKVSLWDESKERLRDHREHEDRKTPERRERTSCREAKRIDREKLLEIARNNVKRMILQGTLPKGMKIDIEELNFASRDGIDHYTDICRKIQKENPTSEELPSVSHPFEVKERPVVQPTYFHVPQIPCTSVVPLSDQFPISSGSTHREHLRINSQILNPDPVDRQVMSVSPFPETSMVPRVGAFNNLVDSSDPFRNAMMGSAYSAAYETGISSNFEPGPPTARFLTPQQLQEGPQAWARKDQFQKAKVINDGIGMQLLQKMGWKPGTPLGKNGTGSLEPLQLAVKTCRKGLVSQQECPSNNIMVTVQLPSVSKEGNTSNAQKKVTLEGKHPVSALLEWAIQEKKPPPDFIELPPSGPDHRMTFLFQVVVEGRSFIPEQRSLTKKLAKAEAAIAALKGLGEVTGIDKTVDMSAMPKAKKLRANQDPPVVPAGVSASTTKMPFHLPNPFARNFVASSTKYTSSRFIPQLPEGSETQNQQNTDTLTETVMDANQIQPHPGLEQAGNSSRCQGPSVVPRNQFQQQPVYSQQTLQSPVSFIGSHVNSMTHPMVPYPIGWINTNPKIRPSVVPQGKPAGESL